MSTLTKILVVLLTLSSIFLCGITVTYVGTATNYKKAYDDIYRNNQSLKSDNANKAEQINTIQANLDTATNSLSNIVDKHQREIEDLNTQLTQKKTDLEVAQKKLENNNTIISDYTKTVEMNDNLRKDAQKQVATLLDEQRANTTKISELQDMVVNLNATIAQIEKDNKRLIEEKTKLQNDLDRSLMAAGKRTGVTASSDLDTAPAIRDIDLEGVILEVRPEDSLASISIGSANGVRNNMRFHVIRNNSFVCDIVISKVDADQASGYLDLITSMPKAGDKVKTNL